MTKEKTPDPLNIYQRLHAVMKDISYVQKEDKKVNNQYKFVSHDAVTAKVRGALVDHGIIATTTVLNYSQDGNRTAATVEMKFINIDAPDDFVAIESFGYGIDPQDKGPGKAVSYAVKYGLLKCFMLETGDDPERDNIEHKSDADKQRDEFKRIKILLEAANDEKETFATWQANETEILTLPDAGQDVLINIRNRFQKSA